MLISTGTRSVCIAVLPRAEPPSKSWEAASAVGGGQEPQLGTCVLSPAVAMLAFTPPGRAQTRAAGHRGQRRAARPPSPTPARGAQPGQQDTGLLCFLQPHTVLSVRFDTGKGKTLSLVTFDIR